MGNRGDITNEQWERLKGLLPERKAQRGRPSQNHRQILNGILWVLRTGAPWRDMPERYGKWTTIAPLSSRRHLVFPDAVSSSGTCHEQRIRSQKSLRLSAGIYSQAYAAQIGAAGYAPDASRAVAIAKHLMTQINA